MASRERFKSPAKLQPQPENLRDRGAQASDVWVTRLLCQVGMISLQQTLRVPWNTAVAKQPEQRLKKTLMRSLPVGMCQS